MLSSTHRSHIIFAFIISVFLLALSPLTLFAQETSGIKISPSLIEERVDPGTEKSYVMRVENLGPTAQVLYPSTRDILGTDVGGQPIFAQEGETSEYALSAWVTFKESSLDLGPNGGAELHFTVRVPKDVTPGAHVGSVSLSSKPPKGTVTGSAVGYEVAAIVSFRVSGEIVEDTRLREFFVNQLIYKIADVHFTSRVENLGNVFVRPKGFVDIKNMWGRKVETLTVNDGGASVFPRAAREYSVDWKSNEFEIGKYTAELSLSVEGAKGMQTLLGTVVFWVIPLNVVLPILGGILVFLVLFYILLRLYVRKQVSRISGGVERVSTREVASLSRLSVVVIALLVAIMLGLALLFFLG